MPDLIDDRRFSVHHIVMMHEGSLENTKEDTELPEGPPRATLAIYMMYS